MMNDTRNGKNCLECMNILHTLEIEVWNALNWHALIWHHGNIAINSLCLCLSMWA